MPQRAYYIPNGPKNLATFFPGIDFNDVLEYYIDILTASDEVIATSTINQLDGECCEDKARIHFLNYLGAVDAVNFKVTIVHEPKSDNFEKPTQYPLEKPAHAGSRFNVKANNIYTAVTNDYKEEDMPWLNELFDSPLAWLEWVGTQEQPDSYIPIMILDTKFENIKEKDRYAYQVTIEFKLSHEKFIIRN